jgi:hypothetical protein
MGWLASCNGTGGPHRDHQMPPPNDDRLAAIDSAIPAVMRYLTVRRYPHRSALRTRRSGAVRRSNDRSAIGLVRTSAERAIWARSFSARHLGAVVLNCCNKLRPEGRRRRHAPRSAVRRRLAGTPRRPNDDVARSVAPTPGVIPAVVPRGVMQYSDMIEAGALGVPPLARQRAVAARSGLSDVIDHPTRGQPSQEIRSAPGRCRRTLSDAPPGSPARRLRADSAIAHADRRRSPRRFASPRTRAG